MQFWDRYLSLWCINFPKGFLSAMGQVLIYINNSQKTQSKRCSEPWLGCEEPQDLGRDSQACYTLVAVRDIEPACVTILGMLIWMWHSDRYCILEIQSKIGSIQSYKCNLCSLAIRIWWSFLTSGWYNTKTHLGSEIPMQRHWSVVKAIKILSEI